MSSIPDSHHTCSLQSVGAIPKGYPEDERCGFCLETAKEMKGQSTPLLITGCSKIIHFYCAKNWVNGEDGEPNLEHQSCVLCQGQFVQTVKLEDANYQSSNEISVRSIVMRVLALFW